MSDGCLEVDGFSIVAGAFSIVAGAFSMGEVSALIEAVEAVGAAHGVRSRGGVYAIRNLLDASPAVRELASSEPLRSMVERAVGRPAQAVRATLFDKTGGANWLVPWHQDLTIVVEERREVPGYGPWTKKAGEWHVQPPAAVLEEMVSARIHLDDCPASNGCLRVLRGTHGSGRLTASEIAERRRTGQEVSCAVCAGDVVLMRPLLLHASSPSASPGHRRVIHIDYAAGDPGGGLRWAPRGARS
jgi:hypothetical protein